MNETVSASIAWGRVYPASKCGIIYPPHQAWFDSSNTYCGSFLKQRTLVLLSFFLKGPKSKTQPFITTVLKIISSCPQFFRDESAVPPIVQCLIAPSPVLCERQHPRSNEYTSRCSFPCSIDLYSRICPVFGRTSLFLEEIYKMLFCF